MSLLPLREESHSSPNEPCVLSLDTPVGDEVFETLTASMTRRVLSIIYDQPSTPTEIREKFDTTYQTVHYHLDKLEEAGLIESAGVEYSEKGTEMTIYVPSNEAVILFAGQKSAFHKLKEFYQ